MIVQEEIKSRKPSSGVAEDARTKSSLELSGRKMPIMLGRELDLRVRRGERVVHLKSVPWEMIAGDASQKQSHKNHGQTLERIAERGGFSASEAIAVISCRLWHALGGDENAQAILYSMQMLFNRGRLYEQSANQKAALNAKPGEDDSAAPTDCLVPSCLNPLSENKP